MKKQTVMVLFGGRSPEHGISLQSAATVLENLDTEKYRPVAVGITREGRWYRFTGSWDAIREDRWSQGACTPAILSPDRGDRGLLLLGEDGCQRLPVDVALPMLHGCLGEDGTVQGLIQLAGIPLAGCGVLASALGMDKEMARKAAAAAGVAVPRCHTLGREEAASQAPALARRLGYPVFVKPARAGSSLGVRRVEEEGQLAPALEDALRYDSRVLLEEAVPGFEVGCAIAGTGALTLGAVDEIHLAGGLLDHGEKYHPVTSVTRAPARLPEEVTTRIKETAVAVYRALDCAGFARVDLFLTPDQQVLFHEVNTIPGFTPHSRYPAMMAAAGISIPEVLDLVISSATEGGE